jgi:hypothetical protein
MPPRRLQKGFSLSCFDAFIVKFQLRHWL